MNNTLNLERKIKIVDQIIGIHQPNYFPWAGYFFKVLQSDTFIFLDDVQYSNNSFTNRTNIVENSDKCWLTLPIKKKLGNNINEILRADPNWKIKHLSKIKNSYKNTSFFSLIYEKINFIFENLDEENLSDINKKIIIACSKWLDCNTKFYDSSSLNLNEKLRGENRILKIIKYFNHTTYLSGEGGKKYLSSDNFQREGVKLIYIDYSEMPYKQFNESENFLSRLSILDLFFNLGIRGTKKYINETFKIK